MKIIDINRNDLLGTVTGRTVVTLVGTVPEVLETCGGALFTEMLDTCGGALLTNVATGRVAATVA